MVEVFESLDKLEKILAGKDYLVGGKLTEADVRLWVTIVGLLMIVLTNYLCLLRQIRFDPVYVGHFKVRPRLISTWAALLTYFHVCQVQHPDHPQWIPSNQSVRRFLSCFAQVTHSSHDRWMKKLYWNSDAFKGSTDFDHIKTHYYWSHPSINPTRIVPVGPFPNIEPL